MNLYLIDKIWHLQNKKSSKWKYVFINDMEYFSGLNCGEKTYANRFAQKNRVTKWMKLIMLRTKHVTTHFYYI